MNTGSDSHANSKIHLVFARDGDSSGMLGGVANDGKEDQTYEGLGNTSTGGNGVDAVDEEFGTDAIQGTLLALSLEDVEFQSLDRTYPTRAVETTKVATATKMCNWGSSFSSSS